jgi:hypothetical protein
MLMEGAVCLNAVCINSIEMDVHQATISVAVRDSSEKVIARLGPMHRYGIAQHIQQTSKDVLQVEESLYRALLRVLIKGWVMAEWGQSDKYAARWLAGIGPNSDAVASTG